MERDTEVARFWARVEKTDGECWRWTGSVDRDGYGLFTEYLGSSPKRLRTHRAHRLAYRLSVGEIQPGLHLDHLCRVRNCVNPAHLEPVTCRENLQRGECLAKNLQASWAKSRAATHCKRGHSLEGRNVYRLKNGRRRCAECERIRGRKHAA